jgi:hypothetical protein
MFRCCVADLGQLKTRNTAVASSSRLDLIPKSMNEVLRRELWCCDLTPGEVVTSDIPPSERSTRRFLSTKMLIPTRSGIFLLRSSPEDGKFEEALI